ncbi:unnamed protein product [Brassica rapa subsp. trilocularis]
MTFHTHMRVYRIGSRQSSIMGSPQVIRYSSIPILSYSISFTSPTQAAITKDLSLTVAEDLSTLCLVLYPTWLLWLVQFPQVRSHKEVGRKGKHMKRLNAPKHWMLDKLGVQTKGHLFPDKLLSSAWRRTRLLRSSS